MIKHIQMLNPEFLTPKQIKPETKLPKKPEDISPKEDQILLELEKIEEGEEDWASEKDQNRW